MFHFWQPGGGYDRNIDNAKVAWASVHYIHANPVRRGLVAHPTDWEWSSARWYAESEDVVLAMDACPPDPPG
jgi:putative transposase